MSISPPSFHTALVAGGIAGATVDLSLFPLDTLRTRLQSSTGFFPSGGIHGIYLGIGSALLGSAPGAAFFFCTYEAAKGLFSVTAVEGNASKPSWKSPSVHIIATSAGEIAACAFRVPTEVIKQRAQTTSLFSRMRRSQHIAPLQI